MLLKLYYFLLKSFLSYHVDDQSEQLIMLDKTGYNSDI